MGWLRNLVYGEIQCAGCGAEMPAYIEDGPNPVFCSPECEADSDDFELREEEGGEEDEEWF